MASRGKLFSTIFGWAYLNSIQTIEFALCVHIACEYVETFRKLNFGTGSALAYVMAIVTFLLAFSVIRTVGKKL